MPRSSNHVIVTTELSLRDRSAANAIKWLSKDWEQKERESISDKGKIKRERKKEHIPHAVPTRCVRGRCAPPHRRNPLRANNHQNRDHAYRYRAVYENKQKKKQNIT